MGHFWLGTMGALGGGGSGFPLSAPRIDDWTGGDFPSNWEVLTILGAFDNGYRPNPNDEAVEADAEYVVSPVVVLTPTDPWSALVVVESNFPGGSEDVRYLIFQPAAQYIAISVTDTLVALDIYNADLDNYVYVDTPTINPTGMQISAYGVIYDGAGSLTLYQFSPDGTTIGTTPLAGVVGDYADMPVNRLTAYVRNWMGNIKLRGTGFYLVALSEEDLTTEAQAYGWGS